MQQPKGVPLSELMTGKKQKPRTKTYEEARKKR